MIFSLIFCGLLSSVFILGRGFFLHLYSNDPKVLTFAVQRLLIATALELLTSTYEISGGAMRGLGHSLSPALITVSVPVSYGSSGYLPSVGVSMSSG